MTENNLPTNPPTSEKLACALEKAGCPPQMVQAARDGYYDDFKSPLATPQIQLAADLTDLGKGELVERVKDGEFDSSGEESAAWFEEEGKHLLPPELAAFISGENPEQEA